MLTINALAADSVLIPVQAHYLPAKGIELLFATINKVRRQINPSLKVEGILLTILDTRSTFVSDMVLILRHANSDFLNAERRFSYVIFPVLTLLPD